jgi:hypothetical protein
VANRLEAILFTLYKINIRALFASKRPRWGLVTTEVNNYPTRFDQSQTRMNYE